MPSRKSGFGGTLFGIFIGVALGLLLAAGVAFYLMKAGEGDTMQIAGEAVVEQRLGLASDDEDQRLWRAAPFTQTDPPATTHHTSR